MNKKPLLIIALLTLSLVGCKAKEVPVEAPIALAVEATTIKRGDIKNQFSYSGKIKALEEANVFSLVAGKVASVNCDVGSTVSAGDVLFQMDTADINNNLNVLRASLSASDANVASAQTGVNLANGASMQSQIEAAKSAVKNADLAVESSNLALKDAQLAYDNAKTVYDNNVQLFNAGIIPKADMDRIQLTYENVTVALEQSKQNCDKALEGQRQANESYTIIVEKMPQENAQRANDALNSAVAGRSATAAQIASAEKSLRDATVTSPISGVVTAKNVVAGTLLSQSSPAFTISDMSKVEVMVGVSEIVINSLNVGDIVDVKISTISDKTFKGTISSVNPAASSGGTYDVKVLLENGEGVLKSGMLAEVYFTKEFSPNTITIPRSCVITKDDETFVYVEEDLKAKKVVVTTGIDTGETIEILNGLEDGMNLISKGHTFVADGDEIRIVTQDGTDIIAAPNDTNATDDITDNNDDKDASDNKKDDAAKEE